MLETELRVHPLREWAEDLASRRSAVVPWPDPAEAGVDARVLVVFEAPGPMTNASNVRPGSGFVSVDNDDLTAENCWRARVESGLEDGVLCWNMVPWYLGTAARKPTASEITDGAAELLSLMWLLPRLDTVVLCGRYAQTGWNKHLQSSLRRPAVRVIETWHPSPLAMNQPGKRAEFVEALRTAAATRDA